jgi:hypothetical protein
MNIQDAIANLGNAVYEVPVSINEMDRTEEAKRAVAKVQQEERDRIAAEKQKATDAVRYMDKKYKVTDLCKQHGIAGQQVLDLVGQTAEQVNASPEAQELFFDAIIAKLEV